MEVARELISSGYGGYGVGRNLSSRDYSPRRHEGTKKKKRGTKVSSHDIFFLESRRALRLRGFWRVGAGRGKKGAGMLEGAACGPSTRFLTLDARPRGEGRAPEAPMVTAISRQWSAFGISCQGGW